MNEDTALDRYYSNKHPNETEEYHCADCDEYWEVEFTWDSGSYWPLNEDDMRICPFCKSESIFETAI